jgi:hypothetical protein
MQADAIILTGQSTLVGYLKRPIERTFERALYGRTGFRAGRFLKSLA